MHRISREMLIQAAEAAEYAAEDYAYRAAFEAMPEDAEDFQAAANKHTKLAADLRKLAGPDQCSAVEAVSGDRCTLPLGHREHHRAVLGRGFTRAWAKRTGQGED